jgi:hypothetical protein
MNSRSRFFSLAGWQRTNLEHVPSVYAGGCSIPLRRQSGDQRRELRDANVVFWVPERSRFRARVTFPHISNIDCSNGSPIIIPCGAVPAGWRSL